MVEMTPQHTSYSLATEHPAKSAGVVTRSVGGATVLVPVRNNVADLDYIYTLDPVGTFIWDRIDGRTSLQPLIAAIVEEFDVDAARAEQDLHELLSDLREAGLVEFR